MLRLRSGIFSEGYVSIISIPITNNFFNAPKAIGEFLFLKLYCRKKIQGLSMPCCESTISKRMKGGIYYEKI
jgi:hypothetical protein